MVKKILLFFVLFFTLNSLVYAESNPCFDLSLDYVQNIPVQIEPASKISTSDVNMQEGDNINLIVVNDVYLNSNLYIKKSTDVVGVITSLINNDFTCQEASIYAENFRVKTVDGKVVKLIGIVHKEGRNHSLVTQYLPIGFYFIRGGEAQILPKKDVFTLYLDTNNKARGVIDDL